MSAQCLWDVGALLGEGPLWSPQARRLYFVDIKAPAVHALDMVSGERRSWPMPVDIGWLIPRLSGAGFLAGFRDGFARMQLEPTVVIDYLGNPLAGQPGCRLNDAKADAQGNVWAGSMHDTEPQQAVGQLFRISPDGQWQVMDSGYHICNGPALSPDGKTLYHTDSLLGRVYAYERLPDGQLGPRRLWRQFQADEGSPDGMTTDVEGCLWIAHWGGAGISRFSPQGERLKHIPLPVSQVTSCTFGGENLDRLFVTSARIGLSDAQLQQEPLAGGLFEIDPGTRGLPAAGYGG